MALSAAVERHVAILGVGTLGSIFADRLLDAGLELTLFDIDDRRVAPLVERGARAATDLTDLVRDADVVLVSLPNPAATQQAVLGPSGAIAACRPGTLIVDTSTIDPTTAREVAREALAVGRAAGLSLDTMLSVLRHTNAQSYWLFNYLAPRLARRDFDDGFSIDLQHKDHRLFGELAAQHNAPTPLNDLALQLYEAMRADGLGRKDLTEAANVAAVQSGVTRFDD